MAKYLVFVGMIISIMGASGYIREMLKGKVKPNRISWLMWSAAPLIASFAEIADGVTLAALPVFMAGACPLVILILSFFKKEAYWKISKLDYGCGALSILALVLWYITKEPVVAIVFCIASDGLACVPTLSKAWKYPKTEVSWPFLGGIISAFTSFAAIEIWNTSSVAYPVYLIVANMIIIFAIERKRIFKSKSST